MKEFSLGAPIPPALYKTKLSLVNDDTAKKFCLSRKIFKIFVWHKVTSIEHPVRIKLINNTLLIKLAIAQLAGAVEYTDCTSAEG